MYRYFFKRIVDITLAVIAMPFWLLILLIVGPLIYFQDKGSIFYIAPRLGKDGKVFAMYKFRSMKMHAPDIRNEDGSTFNAENDPRVTRIGQLIRKTSLDESPQLLNILKGDMSIVGPRPDLPEFIELYEGDDARKLEVRPGVTGYNQAYFRNTIPWKQRVRNDIYYIERMSLGMDVKIIAKTAVTVLKRENVFVAQKEPSDS